MLEIYLIKYEKDNAFLFDLHVFGLAESRIIRAKQPYV